MGSKMRICSTCGGRGQVMRTEQTPFGLFSQVTGHTSFELSGLFIIAILTWCENSCLNPQFLKIFFFLKQYDCESIRTIIFSARK